MLSIIERQRQAATLALQEGAVLSHRHFLLTCYNQPTFRSGMALDNTFRKRRSSPAIPRKFSIEEAAQIRQDYEQMRSFRQLAKKYNCGLRCANQIVRRWGAYKLDP